MKRVKPAKRRDRKTNLSPYARYGKSPVQYSPEYYEGRNIVAHNVARKNAADEARNERNARFRNLAKKDKQ